MKVFVMKSSFTRYTHMWQSNCNLQPQGTPEIIWLSRLQVGSGSSFMFLRMLYFWELATLKSRQYYPCMCVSHSFRAFCMDLFQRCFNCQLLSRWQCAQCLANWDFWFVNSFFSIFMSLMKTRPSWRHPLCWDSEDFFSQVLSLVASLTIVLSWMRHATHVVWDDSTLHFG